MVNEVRLQHFFNPEYELGLATNIVRIKNKDGRFIGLVEAKDVPSYLAMEKGFVPESFVPFKNWRLEFSISLQNELGLAN